MGARGYSRDAVGSALAQHQSAAETQRELGASSCIPAQWGLEECVPCAGAAACLHSDLMAHQIPVISSVPV